MKKKVCAWYENYNFLEFVQQAGDLPSVGNVNGDRSGIMQHEKK